VRSTAGFPAGRATWPLTTCPRADGAPCFRSSHPERLGGLKCFTRRRGAASAIASYFVANSIDTRCVRSSVVVPGMQACR
jgi:hypothetical protein